uniref:Plastid lipid-associated protein/fibrillin conserved domain-containing protein n=1 Tax=Minutocellus polymorphus TaxID=265543 RepID=A0A6U0KQ85_9STRA|eukprot:CAMPEP_0181050450 /NCGR_PEP_ID=MMETSP1070-20121207/16522_1 /TAXON_ID=265543 /ORGANISM="Minutocellus polymorphus, Strain NH13" /LENGTH=250 /DNA_ID=CAMNT_0023129395 /DNA_START=90 /DNA_END=842 /DNA_ORIENTATION=+
MTLLSVSVVFVLLTILGFPSVCAFAPPAIACASNDARGPQFAGSASTTALPIGQLLSDFLPKSQTGSAIDPQRIQDIKTEIKALAKGTSNGISASKEVRNQISQLVAELEAANPTPDLTNSPKLNGSWKLVYTTNEGSSAGKLGPLVGEVQQLIRIDGRDGGEQDYYNFVRVAGGAIEGALRATWDVLAKDKWQVNFKSVRFSVLGIPLVEMELSAVGIWRKSFLDDDFRILYAAGGKNVPKENIYILAK